MFLKTKWAWKRELYRGAEQKRRETNGSADAGSNALDLALQCLFS